MMDGEPEAVQEAEPEALEEVPERAEKEVVKFDPRKPNRLSRKQLDNLSDLFLVLAEDFSKDLSEELRMEIGVEVEKITQERYVHYLKELHNPSCLYEVDLAPMKTPALVILHHSLVFCLVDRILGGSGEADIEPRELTSVESGIAGQFMNKLMIRITEAWKKIVTLTPEIRSYLSDPARVEITHEKDILLVIVMTVTGTERFGNFTLCIPFAALEGYIERIGELVPFREPEVKGREEWVKRLRKSLTQVEVNLSVILGEADLSVRDVMDLKVDDVIVLDKTISDTVRMPVGSQAVLEGKVGVHNERLALKISDIRKLEGDAEEVVEAHG